MSSPRAIRALVSAAWKTSLSYRMQMATSLASLALTVVPVYFVSNALQSMMANAIAGEGTQYFGFLLLGTVTLSLVTTAAPTRFEPVSVFPRIRRDLSFTVDASETFSRIAEHVSVAASSRLKELRIFDVYTGKGVESGRKSVALGLILQDISRTLTDSEADQTVAAVIEQLTTGLNAKLRE